MNQEQKASLFRRLPVSGAIVLAAALGLPKGAQAQEFDDGPVITLDFVAGLRYEDRRNRDGNLEATTRLGVGYFTSTHNQRLSFQTGVTARFNEDGSELISPFAELSYAVFSRGAEIGVDLSYSSVEIEAAELEDDFDAEDLVREDGTREDLDVALSLLTGRTSPFGTETRLTYGDRTFTGGATSDDRVAWSARSTLRFTIDPRIELRLSGFLSRIETDDLLETLETTHRWRAEADLDIDRVWSAALALGYAELETETMGGRAVEEGLEASLMLSRDLRNGRLSFSVLRDITDDGPRDTYRLRRSVELANGGALDASIGFTVFDSGDHAPLASLNYSRELRGGAFSFRFDRSGGISDADELIHRTRLGASFRQDLTRTSSWSIDGALASVENENPATADVLRVDVGLSYVHALTADWNLAARAEHQMIYEDGAIDDRTNVLSLNLERRFSFRP